MSDHTPNPGDTEDGLCALPRCSRPVSQMLPHPICNGHIISIYRGASRWVQELVGDTETGKVERRGPQALPANGVVYFIRLGSLVKIGFSRRLAARLRDLHYEEILGVMEGTMADEKATHRRFAHLQQHGEWFRDCPELRAFIAQEAA